MRQKVTIQIKPYFEIHQGSFSEELIVVLIRYKIMESDSLPEAIFAGPAKTASTWIYECLRDHPNVSVPSDDSIEYFSANYHRDVGWYKNKLGDPSEGKIVDMSNGYFPFIHAPSRIKDDVPDADIVFTVRNPVDRAYSHWWHGRGDKSHTYNFKDVFNHYPKFLWWVRPGFYHEHISRYNDHFSEEQLHIVFFEDLVEDDISFIQSIFSIIGVDDDYVPTIVGDKSNTATKDAPKIWIQSRDWLRSNAPSEAKMILEPLYHTVKDLVESESEYDRGMDSEIRRQLEEVYADDVRALSSMTDRDLTHWFEYVEV